MPKALLKISIFARRGLGQILRAVLPLRLLRRFTPRNDRSSQEGLEALKAALPTSLDIPKGQRSRIFKGAMPLPPRNDENKPKAAFTLAEVLLTLTIIGIIAAMTIPALMNNTNKTENVAALKKAYSTIMQATLMITADNGGDITSALSGAVTNDDFANVFIPKLNVAKICGTTHAKATGCFPDVYYKYLDGTDPAWSNFHTSNNKSTILLNDGMSYSFSLAKADCTSDYSSPLGTTSSPIHDTCGFLWVDINGPHKGPIVDGKDLFCFYITKKGIYPRGAYAETAVDGECSTYGSGCTSQVLLEGAINY
ncbi:MAG: type II secretion system protein [Candidatus Gastranaerophilaceae bacterium]